MDGRTLAGKVVRAFLRRAGAYLDWHPGMSLSDVVEGWQSRGDKINEDSHPSYSARELWPLREYTWTRETARDGFARVDGRSVLLRGPEKWDALREGLRRDGWDPDDPLHVEVGRSGGAKVGEGNHRLGLALDLGLTRVPVSFHFLSGTVTKDPMPPREPVVEVPKADLRRVVREEVRQGPKHEVDEALLDLLGF